MVAQIDRQYIKARPWKLWSRLLGYSLFEGRPLTTRGRWINPILFAKFSLLKRLPQLKNVDKPTFILGTGRSGTTILGIVLSMHRQVGFLNEPKALWHVVHPEEDLIGSYGACSAHYRLDADAAIPDRVRTAHRLFGAYLAASFSDRLVDKYPELIFRLPFVQALFPDAKFLFLARNGWDTCRSIERWSSRLGKRVNGEVHDWWGRNDRKWRLLVDQLVPEHPDLAIHQAAIAAFRNHTDRAAVEWIVTMREGLALASKSPGNVLIVRYESLCDQPENTLKQMTRFLELDDDEVFIDYGKQTLIATRRPQPISIDPIISNAFADTMVHLNYA